MSEKNTNQRYVLKELMSYIKKYMPFIFLSLLFAAVSSVLALYVPILTGEAIDCIVGMGNVDFNGIFEIMKQMLAVILLTAAAQWLMNVCNNRITFQVVRDLREDAFAKIEERSEERRVGKECS